MELALYFVLNNTVYDTNQKKIASVLSYMNRGTAGPWKEMKVQEYANLTNWPTFNIFLANLSAAFSAADAPGDARSKLKSLKQTRTADEYILQFKTLI